MIPGGGAKVSDNIGIVEANCLDPWNRFANPFR